MDMECTGFDWAALMQAGIWGLGLRPDEFWRLTPAELNLMLGRGARAAPLARSRLDELLEAFPDHPSGPERKGTGDEFT